MGSIERDLNDYLFREFGMEGEESSISETWPFNLRRIGEIGVRVIFEFDDDDEPFFAVSGPCLDFLPKNGMTIDDLALQFVGSEWMIMSGLFLRNSRRYLGLFRVPNELVAVVGGLDTPIFVGHERCSALRRLAWGVGQWINR